MHVNSLDKRILAIALPAIVSNITTPVLGLVDVAITGHFGAAAYIGAIAVGTTMFNMLYWLLSFLRMGTAGLTAQAFGANDAQASAATLARALLMALGFSLVLILFSHPLADITLRFIDADSSVEPHARAYFAIGIFGAPAALGMFVLNGWYLGMQNTKIPMWIALLTDITNILASLVLVYAIKMRIEGIALGTITAQWLGFITATIILIRKYKPSIPSMSVLLKFSALKRLFSINIDIFLRTLCLVAVTVWFTRAGAARGVDTLAANALLMQLFMFFSYFSDGFAYAGEALAGMAHGSRNSRQVKSVVLRLLKWCIAVAVIFTIIYALGGPLILRLLTDDSHVIATATTYLPWAVAVPACGILAFLYDGIYVGLTDTRHMLWSMLWAMAIYFALYFALEPLWANHALWLAFISYLIMRGLYLHIHFKKLAK